MSGEDWAVGDLALCVLGGDLDGNSRLHEWPVAGRIYTVAGVFKALFTDGGIDVGLKLVGAPLNVAGLPVWWHGRFRKVTPGEVDADDAEVIAAMTGDSVILIPAKPRRRVGEQVPQ